MMPFTNPMLLSSSIVAKPGEFINISTTVNWKVPPGVFFIHAVAIGGGGRYRLSDDGQSSGGGGGGALMYANNIPVTPGEILTVTTSSISRGSTVLIGAGRGANQPGTGSPGTLNAPGGTPMSTATAAGRVGYSGGAGRRWNGATRGGGGGAARYNGNGIGAGNGSSNGPSTSLYGGNTNSTNNRGGGGGVANGHRGGGVRIIWGEGRSYPNNAV